MTHPDLLAIVREARPEDLPALAGRLREAELLAEMRLRTAVPTKGDHAGEDRNLSADEAARRDAVTGGCSCAWARRTTGFSTTCAASKCRESVGPNKAKAEKKLKARLKDALGEGFVPPSAESVTVGALRDALSLHAQNVGLRSWDKLRSHAKAVRGFFGAWRAIDVSPEAVERFQRDRLAAGRKPATVNRECEALRRAFRLAAERKAFPRNAVPAIPTLSVENTRQGFFERADIEALLAHVEDPDLRDFIACGFHTGMRKGEIAKLTWTMLDTSSEPWLLTIPGSITKNARPRVLGLGGEARAVIASRIKARRSIAR